MTSISEGSTGTGFQQILEALLSYDTNVRIAAEQHMSQMEKTDARAYLSSLAQVLDDSSQNQQHRKLSSIVFKNWLKNNADQWASFPDGFRQALKEKLIRHLGDANLHTTVVATLVSIGTIEISRNLSPAFFSDLLQLYTPLTPLPARCNLLRLLGTLTEEVDKLHWLEISGQIAELLFGAVQQSQEAGLKEAAGEACAEAAQFMKHVLQDGNHRDMIHNMFVALCSDGSNKICKQGYRVMTIIAEAQPIPPATIQTILGLSNQMLESEEKQEVYGAQVVEFWITLVEELTDNDELKESFRPILPQVFEFFCRCLKLQPEVQDMEDISDDYSISSAAGVGVQALAGVYQDDLATLALPFMEQTLRSNEWRDKDAGLMVLSQVVEHIGPELADRVVPPTLPMVLHWLTDPHPLIRDSAAYTLGQLCQHQPQYLMQQDPHKLATLPKLFQMTLADPSPRIANRIGWALSHFIRAVDSEFLTTHAAPLMNTLLETANRADGDEENLRAGAYEAFNEVVQALPDELLPLLPPIIKTIAERLDKATLIDDAKERNESQASLCSVIMALLNRCEAIPLEQSVGTFLMQKYVQILEQSVEPNSSREEVWLVIPVTLRALGDSAPKYIPAIVRYMLQRMSSMSEEIEFSTLCGAIGDLARMDNCQAVLRQHYDAIMAMLLTHLQNVHFPGALSSIVSVIGDIAMASGMTSRYLAPVMVMLKQIRTYRFEEEDAEEKSADLRRAVLEAYSAILIGLNSEEQQSQLLPHISAMIGLIKDVVDENSQDSQLITVAANFVGDLATNFGETVAAELRQPCVQTVLSLCSDDWPRQCVQNVLGAPVQKNKNNKNKNNKNKDKHDKSKLGA